MYANLSEYVKSCPDCQETKQPVHSRRAPLKSLPVQDVFSLFHLDFLGPLPLSNGFRYILVAIDSMILSRNSPNYDMRSWWNNKSFLWTCLLPLQLSTKYSHKSRISLISALCKNARMLNANDIDLGSLLVSASASNLVRYTDTGRSAKFQHF